MASVKEISRCLSMAGLFSQFPKVDIPPARHRTRRPAILAAAVYLRANHTLAAEKLRHFLRVVTWGVEMRRVEFANLCTVDPVQAEYSAELQVSINMRLTNSRQMSLSAG